MTISAEQILMVIGGAASITTAIFWAAFHLGDLYRRMRGADFKLDRHEKMLAQHEITIDEHERILVRLGRRHSDAVIVSHSQEP
jgi:hypothetical protein